jgi:hypothetical protein
VSCMSYCGKMTNALHLIQNRVAFVSPFHAEINEQRIACISTIVTQFVYTQRTTPAAALGRKRLDRKWAYRNSAARI